MFGFPLPAAELKFGVPIGKKWQLTIPVRIYSAHVSNSNFTSFNGHYFDISTGVGARRSWMLSRFGQTEVLYFVEPSVRAGYYSYLAQGAWVGAYLQSGVSFVMDQGLTFGAGLGVSAGTYVYPYNFAWGFVGAELFAMLGYSW
ncbi:MAG: hypothetical protein WCK42_03415 [Myxococcaceae bacterium]